MVTANLKFLFSCLAGKTE